MATRSTIVIEVPEYVKVGKSYQHPCKDKECRRETPAYTIPEGCKYIEVYHHWDGYPSWLGEKLSKIKTFDAVMRKVISGGAMSCLGKPYYAIRMIDKWYGKYGVKPKEYKRLPKCSEAYQYLYGLDKKWYVRTRTNKNFILLSEYMEQYPDE